MGNRSLCFLSKIFPSEHTNIWISFLSFSQGKIKHHSLKYNFYILKNKVIASSKEFLYLHRTMTNKNWIRNKITKIWAQVGKLVYFVPVFRTFESIGEEINLMKNKINSISNDESKYVLLKSIVKQKVQEWSIWSMQI